MKTKEDENASALAIEAQLCTNRVRQLIVSPNLINTIGLQAKDVVLNFDGDFVTKVADLLNEIASKHKGSDPFAMLNVYALLYTQLSMLRPDKDVSKIDRQKAAEKVIFLRTILPANIAIAYITGSLIIEDLMKDVTDE